MTLARPLRPLIILSTKYHTLTSRTLKTMAETFVPNDAQKIFFDSTKYGVVGASVDKTKFGNKVSPCRTCPTSDR